MNIFEMASRRKYRFESTKGALTTEQLWDLKLTDLDAVAKKVNADLKATAEESFITTVTATETARRNELSTKLEIVKHIIATKLAEAEARSRAAERAEQRRKLLDALGQKEDQELSSASKEELLKKLAELDG